MCRAILLLLSLSLIGCATSRTDVRFDAEEPRAVLAILDKRAAQEPITDADWTRIFTSQGYVRLKAREHSMKRAFEDETFRTFVMSDELLAQRDALAATLRAWLAADITGAANRALAYLPRDARIHATVYPAIKPAKNSFVFDVSGDPAIFMYVESQPREVFEATIAHEMHHIGYGAACPSTIELPQPLRDLHQWLGAFGEGVATLAAAGGPYGIPQRKPDVMAEWTKQMAKRDANFHELEQFFTQVLRGELAGDAQKERAFSFFGFVGPWYTVGWTMAVTIEQTLGRNALIDAMCDQRTLLTTYNRAAAEWKRKTGETLPVWSAELANAYGTPASSPAGPAASRRRFARGGRRDGARPAGGTPALRLTARAFDEARVRGRSGRSRWINATRTFDANALIAPQSWQMPMERRRPRRLARRRLGAVLRESGGGTPPSQPAGRRRSV
jgi:hypothetical protein